MRLRAILVSSLLGLALTIPTDAVGQRLNRTIETLGTAEAMAASAAGGD